MIPRRHFLARAIQLVVAATLIGTRAVSAADTRQSTDNTEVDMAVLSHDLFPHRSLDDAVYQRVGQQLVSAGNPALEAAREFLLVQADGQAWASLPQSQRLALLQAAEETPHFALLRAAVIEALYRDEAMWAFIGYGGSAIEHGGYVQRGFDDIDWLPAGRAQP